MGVTRSSRLVSVALSAALGMSVLVLTPAGAEVSALAGDASADRSAASVDVPPVPDSTPVADRVDFLPEASEGQADDPAVLAANLGIDPSVNLPRPRDFVLDKASSVEQVGQRDEYSRTWTTSDGDEVVEMSLLPLHWDRNGDWVEIDSTLKEVSKGVFRSTSNAWSVEFAVSTTGMTLTTEDGPVRFVPVGAAVVAPELLDGGSGVIYRDIWPNVDLVYLVSAGGVKEDLVLKARTKRERFSFLTLGARFDDIGGVLIASRWVV